MRQQIAVQEPLPPQQFAFTGSTSEKHPYLSEPDSITSLAATLVEILQGSDPSITSIKPSTTLANALRVFLETLPGLVNYSDERIISELMRLVAPEPTIDTLPFKLAINIAYLIRYLSVLLRKRNVEVNPILTGLFYELINRYEHPRITINKEDNWDVDILALKALKWDPTTDTYSIDVNNKDELIRVRNILRESILRTTDLISKIANGNDEYQAQIDRETLTINIAADYANYTWIEGSLGAERALKEANLEQTISEITAIYAFAAQEDFGVNKIYLNLLEAIDNIATMFKVNGIPHVATLVWQKAITHYPDVVESKVKGPNSSFWIKVHATLISES